MAAAILWGHALAALLFGAGAVLVLRGQASPAPIAPRRVLAAALALTGLWALAFAGTDPRDPGVRLAEGLRDGGWLAVLAAMRLRAGALRRSAMAVCGVLAVLVAAATAIGIVAPPDMADAVAVRLCLRVLVMLGALVLLVPLVSREEGGAWLVAGGFAALWGLDLAVAATGWAGLWGGWGWPAPLVAARGLGFVLVALAMIAGLARPAAGAVAVSPAAARHAAVAFALLVYLAGVVVATDLAQALGGEHARLIQAGIVVGAATSLATVASSSWLRAWMRVKVAKHLFQHRYDYREAWQRFSDTLGDTGPVADRVARAVAQLAASPAALVYVARRDRLVPAAAWNWPDGLDMGDGAAAWWRDAPRIVALDAARSGEAPAAEVDAVPPGLLAQGHAWAIVPLAHGDMLAGVAVLARPPLDRALDWEDFDLLRVAGRQAAVLLAQDDAHAALADAARFDEFNRRFAFILHDIKNLVSQMSLVARNAERHADNPAFRADMVATVRDSSDRLGALLARLSRRAADPDEAIEAVALAPMLATLVAARRDPRLRVVGTDAPVALAQRARLAGVIEQLVQNALDASGEGSPVTLAAHADDGGCVIEVADRGCGMSAGFVRDELFRAFASSKPNGFGLGAFEARQRVEAMGGRIEVHSVPGSGTRFRIRLPTAPTWQVAA